MQKETVIRVTLETRRKVKIAALKEGMTMDRYLDKIVPNIKMEEEKHD